MPDRRRGAHRETTPSAATISASLSTSATPTCRWKTPRGKSCSDSASRRASTADAGEISSAHLTAEAGHYLAELADIATPSGFLFVAFRIPYSPAIGVKLIATPGRTRICCRLVEASPPRSCGRSTGPRACRSPQDVLHLAALADVRMLVFDADAGAGWIALVRRRVAPSSLCGLFPFMEGGDDMVPIPGRRAPVPAPRLPHVRWRCRQHARAVETFETAVRLRCAGRFLHWTHAASIHLTLRDIPSFAGGSPFSLCHKESPMDTWLSAHRCRRSVHGHVPSNVRTFKFNIFDGRPKVSTLGFHIDPKPFEGKVIATTDEAIVVKTDALSSRCSTGRW